MDRQTHEIPAHRPLAATHSANMQRPHRPSPLDLRSTPSIRDNLAIASAAARGPKTAPCEEPSLPTLAIQPASGTVTPTPVVFSLGPPTSPSPMSGAFQTPVARSSLRVSHKGSAASLSSFLGTCPPPARDNTQDERSNATVRGVAFDTSSIQESDCGRHCGERSPGSVDAERQPLNRYVYTRSPRYGSIRWKGDPRRTHTSRAPPREAIHGVWLAVQCWAFLAVFAVLTSMTVWQSDSSPGFCAWIWTVPQPIFLVLSLSTFAVVLVRELCGLSTVLLLYLQSAIVAVVSITCLVLAARSFEQDNTLVKGVMLGCAMAIWGGNLLGFVRVVVVWRAEGRSGQLSDQSV